jgi:hypothetical protein
MTDEEILKAYYERTRTDTDFSDLITTYSEGIKELMALARKDEREKQLDNISVHAIQQFENGKQAGREEAKKEKCCYCDNYI